MNTQNFFCIDLDVCNRTFEGFDLDHDAHLNVTEFGQVGAELAMRGHVKDGRCSLQPALPTCKLLSIQRHEFFK